MKTQKVTGHNLDECSDGTLLIAFKQLDKVDASDTGKVLQAIELQTKISHELEQRGWTYDDEEDNDWVIPVNRG